jgi:hypothetical protein
VLANVICKITKAKIIPLLVSDFRCLAFRFAHQMPRIRPIPVILSSFAPQTISDFFPTNFFSSSQLFIFSVRPILHILFIAQRKLACAEI